jgi:hypothetical protein
MGKRSSKRTVIYAAMRADAHSERESRAARDVTYDIYARTVVCAGPLPH